MLRRFLSPILSLALVIPSALPIAVFADDSESSKSSSTPAESPPEWRNFIPKTGSPNSAAVREQLDKNGFLKGVADEAPEAGWVGKSFDELDQYLNGLKAKLKPEDAADFAKVRPAFEAELAKLIQEHYRKHEVKDAELKKLLDDPEALADLLGEKNKWTSRILLDALASKDSAKLDRLAKEMEGKDPKAFLTQLNDDLSIKDKNDPRRIAAEKIMQRIDGGKVDGKPPAPGDGDSTVDNGNERRIGRSEEALASIGFSGRQAYGEVGDRHVYLDASGNKIAVTLATISRPDGTKDDLLTIVNLNDRDNPKGTSYSLRDQAERLKAGVAMELNGVKINLQIGAGGEIALTGADGGGFQNAMEPPSGPMNLNTLYAYRAARVYQYGKVVTIGGKEYYAAPEAYGMLQGEGEATKVQGYGQITYWPVDDLRKIFGEQLPDGSWVDKIDPQTFDAKDLNLTGTAFAAGFSTLRPTLGATVVKREGFQDVQILRASAGQDSQGRWWDAVFENGQYVMKPGLPPQTPGTTPTTPPGQDLPDEEKQKIVEGLQKTLDERNPGSGMKFAFSETGQLGLFAGGQGFVLPAMGPDSLAQIGFLPSTDPNKLDKAILAYPTGSGNTAFAFTDLTGSNPAGGVANTVVIKQSGGGFEIVSGSAPRSIFDKLVNGQLAGLNGNFLIKGDLSSVLGKHMQEYPKFKSIAGKSGKFTITLEGKADGDNTPHKTLYFSQDGTGKWSSSETAGDGDQTDGNPGELAFGKGENKRGVTVPAERFALNGSPGVMEGYTAIVPTKNAGVYTQDEPEDGKPQDAIFKFYIVESPDLKANRPSTMVRSAVLLETPLRTILRNHPVSKKDRITQADLAGFVFNTNIILPDDIDATRVGGKGSIVGIHPAFDKDGKSIVYLVDAEGKKYGWLAAWGDDAKGLKPGS